jgi:hypothetical protein
VLNPTGAVEIASALWSAADRGTGAIGNEGDVVRHQGFAWRRRSCRRSGGRWIRLTDRLRRVASSERQIGQGADAKDGDAGHRHGGRHNPRGRFARLFRRTAFAARIVRPHLDVIGVNRVRNIFDLLLADIGKLDGQFVRDLLVHGARNADAADRRDTFESRGDIDAVAQQVAVALDHVANRDADAKAHLPARRISEVARAQAFLDVDGAAHRLHRARKLGQYRIAGGIENAAPGPRDEIVHHRAIRRQAPQRFLFVLGDEPAVAGDVGSEDGRDFSFHGPLPQREAYNA